MKTMARDAEIEAVAARAARRAMARAGRRHRSVNDTWVIRLAAALLGPDRVNFGDSTSHYRAAERRIVIDHASEDIAFACAHELGHFAWFEILGLDASAPMIVQERFANAFARWLLRRDAWDVVTIPSEPVESLLASQEVAP